MQIKSCAWWIGSDWMWELRHLSSAVAACLLCRGSAGRAPFILLCDAALVQTKCLFHSRRCFSPSRKTNCARESKLCYSISPCIAVHSILYFSFHGNRKREALRYLCLKSQPIVVHFKWCTWMCFILPLPKMILFLFAEKILALNSVL